MNERSKVPTASKLARTIADARATARELVNEPVSRAFPDGAMAEADDLLRVLDEALHRTSKLYAHLPAQWQLDQSEESDRVRARLRLLPNESGYAALEERIRGVPR